ncbi:hypothetical protein ABE867_12100 [Enterococcus gallinarum]|uniref:hypothetical protein n=1 Tax=Enterococcus gallinarum TaxID=1353 RepID=UPI003D6C28F9
MEIKEKIEVCIVKDGKIGTELPDDFEWLFLSHYMKSNGWAVSGSAFSGDKDFIIWLKEEENKDVQELLPKSGIAPELFSQIKKNEEWLCIDVSIVVKTIFQ